MSELSVQQGPHYHLIHAGPFTELAQYAFQHPLVRAPVEGKLFLKELLGMGGIEVSLNRMPPGAEIPFTHRHNQNDEQHIFTRGRRQLQVDGETFEVREGTVVRISPPDIRVWRNHSDEELHYIVIPYPAAVTIGSTLSDGARGPGRPRWPE